MGKWVASGLQGIWQKAFKKKIDLENDVRATAKSPICDSSLDTVASEILQTGAAEPPPAITTTIAELERAGIEFAASRYRQGHEFTQRRGSCLPTYDPRNRALSYPLTIHTL